MSPRDENDLTDQELLAMWAQGEPAIILESRVEADLPWLHELEPSTRGAEPRPSTMRIAPATSPRDLKIREALDTEAAA